MSKDVKPCPHDLSEKESACADGSCPLCCSERIALLESRLEAAGKVVEAAGETAAEDYQWPTKRRRLTMALAAYEKEKP